jgi:energy-coupling factor transporter ATP-binding protein EcfA2
VPKEGGSLSGDGGMDTRGSAVLSGAVNVSVAGGAAVPAMFNAWVDDCMEVEPLGDAAPGMLGLDGLAGQRTTVQNICKRIVDGENVAFIGRAGSGKSQFIRDHLPAALQEKYGRAWRRRVMLTSLTGITALAVGGVTFHSATGIGQCKLTVIDTVARMPGPARQRWLQPQITIIVDEIDFLSGDVFDKAFEVGKSVRGVENLDMGGVQWLVFGDVLQLGPVPEWEAIGGLYARSSKPSYVFDCHAWESSSFNCVLLVGTFRQEGASSFGALLDRVSVGCVDEGVTHALNLMLRPRSEIAWREGVALFCGKPEARIHCDGMLREAMRRAEIAGVGGSHEYEAQASVTRELLLLLCKWGLSLCCVLGPMFCVYVTSVIVLGMGLEG